VRFVAFFESARPKSQHSKSLNALAATVKIRAATPKGNLGIAAAIAYSDGERSLET